MEILLSFFQDQAALGNAYIHILRYAALAVAPVTEHALITNLSCIDHLAIFH